MEHINILNRIIEADKNARVLTGEAADKRERLGEEIALEIDSLRKGHMDRARERAAAGYTREKERSVKIMAELDEALKRDIAEVDRKLSARRDELAARVLGMIVGEEG